jgi:co-chaperonin GroES (HSP10)
MTREEALKKAAEIEACGYHIADKKIGIIRDTGDEVSKGGIIIPDDAKNVPLSGTIVMIGETIMRDQAEENKLGLGQLRLGQWVTFSKYHGALHRLALPSGDLEIEVMHAADIYIMWSKS